MITNKYRILQLLCSDERQSFVNHTQAVACFLNASLKNYNKTELTQNFHLYIIARSHKKMYWRVALRLSTRFRKIINAFGDDDIPRCYGQYSAPIRFSDKPLIRSLHRAGNWLAEEGIHIPTLLSFAEEDCDDVLYSQTACTEFHHLLRGILLGYESNLKKLKNGLPEFKRLAMQADPDGDALLRMLDDLTIHTMNASHYASYLKRLAYSQLIQTHFQIMSFPFYQEWLLDQRSGGPPLEESEDDWTDVEDDDSDLGDHDELIDLYSNVDSKPSDTGTAFLQWLRLQVKPRVAVDRLTSLNLQRPVSIDVIDSMNHGNPTEPWEKTIRDLASRSPIEDLDKIIEELKKILPDPFEFDGTLHCEAILGSLITILQDNSIPVGVDEKVIQSVKVCPLNSISTCTSSFSNGNTALRRCLHRRLQAMLSRVHTAAAFSQRGGGASCGACLTY
jgi:hypothetical protein